ncbi:LysR family transcriptional regulator [Faunimonas pinastri]|uniref:LysR family transcriptional regulator n=1 Tax=Faunimonas pinastri TaxID=1855383 RepID=UPI0015A5C680|nr:LysR family transcriptional regulator [Faunimonas pinastri]
MEAFRAVMISGAFSAAAQLMHVTQPAISRLIRDFEAEIGFSLFERDGNRIIPMEEAVLLYREVEQLYVGLEQIGRVAQDIRAVRGGVLRVGSVTSLNGICMRLVVPEFARRFPDVTVLFDTESTERVFDLVAIRHYDLGLVYSGERNDLPCEEIAGAEAVTVMAPDHPLASQDEIGIEDLDRYRMILPGRRSPLRLLIDQALRQAGITPRTPIEASLANCCALARQGLGVTVLDPLVASEHGTAVAVRPFRPRLRLSYSIVRPPQAPQSQLTLAFIAILKEAFRQSLGAGTRQAG